MKTLTATIRTSLLLLACLIANFAHAQTGATDIQVSGTVSRPAGTGTDGIFLAQVVLTSRDDTFSQTQFTTVNVPIQDGETTESFTLTGQAFADDLYRLFFQCLQNCGNALTGAQFTPDGIDYNFTELSIDQLPSNIDFTYDEGTPFSGRVELPSGVAVGDIPIFINVEVSDSSGETFGSFSRRFSIPDNDNGVDFSYPVLNLPGATFKISYTCDDINLDSNCGIFIVQDIFLTATGISFDREDPLTDLSSLPNNLTLLLVEGVQVSGTVSFPNNFTTTGNVRVFVTLLSQDSNGDQTNRETLFLDIPDGSTSIPYSVSLPPNAGGTYTLGISCDNLNLPSNCDGLFTRDTFFTPSGVVLENQDARIQADQFPTTANLSLVRSQVVSGNVILAENGVASTDAFTTVEVRVLNELGGRLGSYAVFPSIPTAQSSAPYELEFPVFENFDYQLAFTCDFDCPLGTIQTLFFTPTGNVQDASAAILDAAELPELIDLQFEQAPTTSISGSIALPNGTANDAIDVFINFEVLDSQGNFVDFVGLNETIAQNDSSVQFTATFPELQNGQFRVNYGCNSNCGLLLRDTYFTPDEILFSFDFNGSVFPASELPSPLNLTLVEGQSFTGQVSLPSGTASGDVSVFVNVNGSNADDNFVYSVSNGFSIADGTSSVSFELGLPPIAADSARLNFGCTFNCDDLLGNIFFTPSGNEFDFGSGLIDFAQLPSNPNLVLVEGNRIDGTITLAGGASATGAAIPAFVSVRNVNGNQADFGIAFASTSISDGTSSSPFSLLVPPGNDREVVVEISCDRFLDGPQACQGFTVSSFFTLAGSGYRVQDSTLTIGQIPDPLNVILESGTLVNFLGQIPDNPATDLFTRIPTTIQALDANDILVGTQELAVFASQEFPFTDSIGLINVGVGGRYEITYECDANGGATLYDCTGFQLTDPSYSSIVDADNIPNPIILEIIEEVIAPQPDAFEVDNTEDLAMVIPLNRSQRRTLHEAGDVDWATFTIDEEIETLTISAIQGASDTAVIMSLFNSDFVEIATAVYPQGDNLNPPRQFAEIALSQLAAGQYFIKVEASSPADTVSRYDLRVRGPGEDELCLPVRTSGGSVVLICL